MTASTEKLLEIMRALRDPDSGCPWDVKQSYDSVIPYTIEEVYEVAEAIDNKDYESLKDELGDLLFQVVFYAQIAAEEKRFQFDDVVAAINEKLVRRHPHVFAGESATTEEALHRAWEKQKHRERTEKNAQRGESEPASLMDDIPSRLPELKKAQKIQKRAAKHGFDWPEIVPVFAKIEEEIAEVRDAMQSSEQSHIEEEIGDLLFSVVNLSRHLKVDADRALAKANTKFVKRFRQLENYAEHQVESHSLEQLEGFWQRAKQSTDK